MPTRPPTPPAIDDAELPDDPAELKRLLVEARTETFLHRGFVRAASEQALIMVELVSPSPAEVLAAHPTAADDPEIYLDAAAGEAVLLSSPDPPPGRPRQPDHFARFQFRLLRVNRASALAWGFRDEREFEGSNVDGFLGTRAPPAVYLVWKSMWIKAVLDGLRWHALKDPEKGAPQATRCEYTRWNPVLQQEITMQGNAAFSGLHPVRGTPLASTFMTNVSALKQALKTAARQGEEIERKNEELRRKNEELKRGEEVKMRFVASVSHELRTPLNGICGLVNTLLEDDSQNLLPEQVEALHLIRQCGDSLLRNVSDILLFSRLSATGAGPRITLHPHPFELLPALRSALKLLELRAASEGLDFEVLADPDVPRVLVADEARLLGTVMGNLVSNAVKFCGWGTEPGLRGRVSVRCSLLDLDRARRKARLRFVVLDTGHGIPEDKRDSVFVPFSSFVKERFPIASAPDHVSASGTIRASGSLRASGPLHASGSLHASASLQPGGSLVPSGSLSGHVLPNGPFPPDAKTLPRAPASFLSPFDGPSSSLTLSSGDLRHNSYLPSEGTGLGLVIVRQIVEEVMGGSVGYDSPRRTALGDPDPWGLRGTEFWVEVEVGFLERGPAGPPVVEEANGHAAVSPPRAVGKPRAPPPLPATGLPVAEAPERTRTLDGPPDALPLKVLVVEDNPINMRVLLRFLERVSRTWPLESSSAFDGQQAVDLFFADPTFDLVLMDLALPKLSGIEAAREIRRVEPGGSRTRIVAVTANVLDSERERCMEGGLMDGFVGKPVAFEELKALVGGVWEAVRGAGVGGEEADAGVVYLAPE